MDWTEIQQGPAFGYTIVGLIVVFGPLVAERLRLPGLLGLLLGGAVIGPNMLDVLPSFVGLESIGSIGVLYLIFLAGLQLDIESFIQYRKISVGFGLLTAFIPMALGTAAALALDIDFTPALLIGSLWASFTLITYPTVNRYGLTRNRSVAAIVGASSITDTISLIVLALIVGAETGDSGGFRLVLGIVAGLGALALWCLVVVPTVARWFFAGMGQERTLRFMLVLISLTSSAVVAELVGIEALIGAFFVGVGLNRVVPNASPLMTMTDFFGNAFFIPTFLVSVGLLFDPEVMFVWPTIRLALGFAAALLVGKALAAWLSGRVFDLTTSEVGLMFSMSVAQAAATLAATIIGLEVGLYGDDVVNAVMVVVAVSLILTSIGTTRFAPQITPPQEAHRRVAEAVLVPVDVEETTLREVFRLAGTMTESVGGVIQPLAVATSTDEDAVEQARRQQTIADGILRQIGQDVETDLRIDRSVAAGLNRAAIQTDASMLLLAWPGPGNVRRWLVGANYSEIIAATALPVGVVALHDTLDFKTADVVVLARRGDLTPGDRPSVRLALEVAGMLRRRDEPLAVGPLSPEHLLDADIQVSPTLEHRPGSDDIAEWAAENTRPGDVVIIPIHDIELRPSAIKIFESGRSVIAVTHNPESQSALNGSTMTLPVGGTIAPN